MTPLPAGLKKAVEDASHDNSLLLVLSPEERELFGAVMPEDETESVHERVALPTREAAQAT